MTVITPEELLASRGPGLVLVDARSGPDARACCGATRLAGALHVDLERDLAAHHDDAAQGGRHPLPAPSAFARVLAQLGVTPASVVVAYDDKGCANAASRFWWMLRASGHEHAHVLDGGIDAAIAAGFPIESGAPFEHVVAAGPSMIEIDRWERALADVSEVERALRDPKRLVIDVRDPSRYRGEGDPFDPVSGHMPGAINVPFASNLGEDGRFLTREALAEKYCAVIGDRDPADVIVHCGSGVTACHTLVALERAGIVGAKLYVGSWSEWSRSGRPVAKGSEPG